MDKLSELLEEARRGTSGLDLVSRSQALDRAYRELAAAAKPLGVSWQLVTRPGHVRQTLAVFMGCTYWARIVARKMSQGPESPNDFAAQIEENLKLASRVEKPERTISTGPAASLRRSSVICRYRATMPALDWRWLPFRSSAFIRRAFGPPGGARALNPRPYMRGKRRTEGTQAMAGTNSERELLTEGPAIILAFPQLGENIGMVARAMANFGLSELRLVSPRDGWPSEKARSAASRADHVIDGAKLYETLEEALADLNFVYATTARDRDGFKPVRSPIVAARELRHRFKEGEKVGIIFGRERTGLTNAEVALADEIVTFPVNPAFASLNLAQAVLLMSYEW